MGRHSHNGAGAVRGQHIVGNKDRDFRIVDRVDAHHALQAHAGLILIHLGALKIGLMRRFLLIGAHRVQVLQLVRPLFNQRVLRRNNHISGAEQGVRPGGVHGQGVAHRGAKVHLCTGGTADPILLLHLDPINKVQVVQIIHQPLGIGSDLQHPLALVLADHLAAAALAHAVDHFFVGQHALTRGAPVHGHFLLVSQALFEHLEEDPLGPLVVFRIGGIDLPGPVKAKAQRLELLLKVCNVVLGHNLRVNVVLNGVVLGRQAKGVPAHGVQHIVALQTLFASHNIQRRVRAGMTHMQALAGGVRELHQAVILRQGKILLGCKGVVGIPIVLPLLFDLLKIILHYSASNKLVISCFSPSPHRRSSW